MRNLGITDIRDIEGLDQLSNLDYLYLENNKIKEIAGLEKLRYLHALDLTNNQITEIKGLENLNQLMHLNVNNNKIPSDILGACGGTDSMGNANSAQRFVGYCCTQKNKPKISETVPMPQVQQAQQVQPTTSGIKEKLHEIDDLKAEGLISENEYQNMRKEILNNL